MALTAFEARVYLVIAGQLIGFRLLMFFLFGDQKELFFVGDPEEPTQEQSGFGVVQLGQCLGEGWSLWTQLPENRVWFAV